MNKKFVTLAVAAAIAIPGMTILPALADDDVPANEVSTVDVTEPAADAVAAAAPQSDEVEAADQAEDAETLSQQRKRLPKALPQRRPRLLLPQNVPLSLLLPRLRALLTILTLP